MKLKINKIARLIRRLTVKRLVNLLITYFQEYIQKGDVSLGKPMTLVFDPSSICNLHCPLCPNGQNRPERTRISPTFEEYKKVIDDLKDSLLFITLANWGEPLLNKKIVDMVDYANKRDIDTSIYTNLTLLNTNMAEGLVKAGLDEIVVSLDGATEKTYLKYRIGGNFQKVLQGLKLLVKLKHKYSSRIVIKWQFIVSSQTEAELTKAKKMASEIGVRFYPVMLRVDMGKETHNDRKMEIKNHLKWFPKIKNFQRYNLSRFTNRKVVRNCYWLWMKTVVNSNGSVSPCCAVWDESQDFGNAFKTGVLNIWNGKKYQEARRLIRTRKEIKNNVCSNCLKNGFIT